MKVILFGATGMVGSGVLRECLMDPGVEEVFCLGRSPTGLSAPKLRASGVITPGSANSATG